MVHHPASLQGQREGLPVVRVFGCRGFTTVSPPPPPKACPLPGGAATRDLSTQLCRTTPALEHACSPEASAVTALQPSCTPSPRQALS